MFADHPLARIGAEMLAVASVVAPILHAMPEIGSLLGVLWYGFQIHDRLRAKK